MKKLTLTLIAIVAITLSVFGQAPESFNYQAVIRNASNEILVNQSIGVQIILRQTTAAGTPVYSETFSPTTNTYGSINLEIGTGTTTDDFSTIDWSSGPYFIETAIDPTGGVSYAVVGTSQLISSPYALYAKNAEIVDDADADPTNEIQDISLSGTDLTISDGSTVDLTNIADDGDWVVTSGTNFTNGNDGNIGIGDIAPTQNRWKLTVKDDVNCMLDTETIDVSELFAVFTRNLNENNTGIGIGFQSTSTVTGMGAAIVHERTNSNSRGKLHFATKSSGAAADEDLPIRMTLDETGDLGIGVTSPSAKLHVSDGDVFVENGLVGIGEASPQASLDVSDIAVIGNLSVGAESTDQGTSVATGLGFTTTPWLYTNAIEAQGERGSASTLITVGADGTYGAADQIHMVTSGNSQVTVAADGKVGFDKATPDVDLHIRQSQQSITNGTGGIKLEDSSDAADFWRIYHSGIYLSFNFQADRVAYINTTGAWTVDSDRRLKYDIKPLQPVLDRVMQLKPVDYLYNEQKPTENKVIGFVAQEVKPLFPEIVVDSEEDKLGITYGATGVIAIKAIQEQQKIIEEQKTEIEDMKLLLQQLVLEVNELKKKN
jgi:hypothetical protein